MADFERVPSSIWFPPEVVKSFVKIRTAMSRGRYSQVDYLSQKYQRKFPAYRGYYLEKEAIAHKRRGRKAKSLNLLKMANNFFQGQSEPTFINLVTELIENDITEAEISIQQGLKNFPDSQALLKVQSELLIKKEYYQEAILLLEKLCEKFPTSSGNEHYLLGECLLRLGMYEKAVQEFKKSHELDPDLKFSWINHIFFMHYIPYNTHADILDCIDDWYNSTCKVLPPTNPALLQRKKKINKKLRIGFFSSGFRSHPVGWMAAKSIRWLSHLPNYEFFFYSLHKDIDRTDSLRQVFKAASSKWLDVPEMNEIELYKRAVKDKLDIAIDLCGHADGCVLSLFACRIAPIQVKWVGGLFDTTGVPQMDYLFSDRYQTPDGCDNKYKEKIIRLPNSYISYSLLNYGESCRVRTNESEPLCFGCFNNSLKLNPVIAEVWCRILKKVPHSILFLKDSAFSSAQICEYILGLFTQHGIDESRIHIEGRSPHTELMHCYNRVDIALDPWPYTGGLTTLEALWMGVPVITTPGPTFAGRHATSHLCNVGLNMLVAENFDHYIDLAVRLANNQTLLNDLRTLIPYSVATSSIVRHEQLAADLHTAFQAIWERYCKGLPPIAMRFEQQSEIPEIFLNKEKD